MYYVRFKCTTKYRLKIKHVVEMPKTQIHQIWYEHRTKRKTKSQIDIKIIDRGEKVTITGEGGGGKMGKNKHRYKR